MKVVGLESVPPEEPLSEIGATAVGEVHRQQRDIAGRIDSTVFVAKLEAVDEDWLGVVPLEPDVLEMEVTVSVHQTPGRPSNLEGVRVLLEEILRQLGSMLDDLPGSQALGALLEHAEILGKGKGQPAAPLIVRQGCRRRDPVSLMESRECLCNCIDMLLSKLPSADQTQSIAALGQSTHDDAVLRGFARERGGVRGVTKRAKVDSPVGLEHRGPSEIDIGSQAAVEFELA
jgi:hypothetical protein